MQRRVEHCDRQPKHGAPGIAASCQCNGALRVAVAASDGDRYGHGK